MRQDRCPLRPSPVHRPGRSRMYRRLPPSGLSDPIKTCTPARPDWVVGTARLVRAVLFLGSDPYAGTATCHGSLRNSASQANPADAASVPSSTGTRDPTLLPIQPDAGPATSMITGDSRPYARFDLRG